MEKQIYILGLKPNQNELTVFNTVREADFESEEWVKIKADSLETAKSNYDKARISWEDLINRGESDDGWYYETN